MRGIFIGLGLVLLLVVAGCNRKIVSSTTTKVRDSLIVKEVPRIVTVTIPGDTVTVKEYIECDSITNKPKPKEFKSGNGRAKVSVMIADDGSLTATGGCDSLQRAIEVRDKIIEKFHSEEKNELKTVVEYKTRGIDKFCRWFTAISIILIVAYIFYRLNKII